MLKYWRLSMITVQGAQTCNYQIFKTRRCKHNHCKKNLMEWIELHLAFLLQYLLTAASTSITKYFGNTKDYWLISYNLTLREESPNTEFFLFCTFLNSVQIQENTDQKKLRIWALFTQWLIPFGYQMDLLGWGWKIKKFSEDDLFRVEE